MMKCIEKNSKSIKTQKSEKTAKVNRQVDKDKQWAGPPIESIGGWKNFQMIL